jgi:segregation and condensation protein A
MSDGDQLYQVQLPEFEGPLDLLLHLVKRHELSILEIPIAFVTEKYLEYLEMMAALNLDIAGEYLLMAATLAHLKSRELLPRQDDQLEDDDEEDEGENPKEELIRRLLNYQRYKEAAEHLGEQPTLGKQVFPRGSKIEKGEAAKDRPLAEIGIFELIAALQEVVKRSKVNLSYDVMVDRISISQRVNDIVDRLSGGNAIRFVECFDLHGSSAQVRHEIVVTFLAILEMAKLKMLRIMQHAQESDIYITRTDALRSVEMVDTNYA